MLNLFTKYGIGARDAFIFGIYCALILGIYYTTLGFLFYQLRIWEDYNYGFIIPLVVLYILWEKRDQLQSVKGAYSYLGLGVALAGLGLFWIGELGGELFMQYISLWLVISGLTWMHLGWHKFKIILFPIAFLLTMFPLPHFVTAAITLQLKLISSKLGVMALQAAGHTAYREGNVIDLGFTQLQVVDACSGLRYLIPLFVLSIIVSYFSKGAWWKKLLVIASTIPISLIINGGRIALAGLLFPVWGPRVVEGFFHDFSGWLIFMLSLGILWVEMWLLNSIVKTDVRESGDAPYGGKESQPSAVPGDRPTLRYLSPHFAIATVLLTASLAMGHTIEFREKVVIAKSLDQFPKEIRNWSGREQQMGPEILEALNLSDYTMIDFTNGQGNTISFYVAYYESQQKAESIHSPSTCLPAGGWVFDQTGNVRLPIPSPDGAMPVNRAVMQKGAERMLVYYWFPMRGRVLTNAIEMKLYNFWDALTRHRTDGALVRMITPVDENEPLAQAEARLQAFAGDVVPLLDAYLPR